MTKADYDKIYYTRRKSIMLAGSKQWYIDHPHKRAEYRKKRYSKVIAILRAAKSKPCMDCNKGYPFYVMDFDHRESKDKKFTLARSYALGYSEKKILQEIEKCDVVCSNCHRIRTFKNNYK